MVFNFEDLDAKTQFCIESILKNHVLNLIMYSQIEI